MATRKAKHHGGKKTVHVKGYSYKKGSKTIHVKGHSRKK